MLQVQGVSTITLGLTKFRESKLRFNWHEGILYHALNCYSHKRAYSADHTDGRPTGKLCSAVLGVLVSIIICGAHFLPFQ